VPVNLLVERAAKPIDAVPEAVFGRLMLAFRGRTVPHWLRTRLAAAPVAGFTLFRPNNVRSPRQVRRLTAGLQAGARARDGDDGLPILIATDQEGGQLLALGATGGTSHDWTGFAGPMAIGATGDADLAERVGRAIGLELRAVGVNVNYAPVLDVATNPSNPALGIRSFGDDPAEVARLASAWLGGLQSAGVAGTGKHFPGKGEGSVDTHHALDVVNRTRDELDTGELVPFRAATEAGVRLVMSGHFAVPALTGSRALPSTLSREVMSGLLREELGFTGVSITDALDMGALPQDATQAIDVVTAPAASCELPTAPAAMFPDCTAPAGYVASKTDFNGTRSCQAFDLTRNRVLETEADHVTYGASLFGNGFVRLSCRKHCTLWNRSSLVRRGTRER
jgi:beta-N-acetylhexosaminidase